MLVRKYLKPAILAAFAAEVLCTTYFLKIPHGRDFCAILYFLSGISLGILLLYSPELKLPRVEKRDWNNRPFHYRIIMLLLLALSMYTLCRFWFDEIPMDINYADMLPIIKVMGQRFASGHSREVYNVIPWIWTGVQPIYLPAMWLPFVPAVVMDIDLRWITAAALFFTFSIFIFVYRPVWRNYLSFFTGVLAYILFWYIFADDTPGVITASEEGVVIAYYVLLVIALLTGNPFLTGIATSLCMLSRYALVGWIPAFLGYLLLRRKWKQSVIFVITGLCCFVLLFLLPVGWTTFLRLAKLPGEYVHFATLVWHDSPQVFTSGLGFAAFFGPKGVPVLHTLLISASFGVPLVSMLFFHFRSRVANWCNIPLAVLKISLVVFYSFIDVPYQYLFYTSSFVSLLLVTLVIQGGASEPFSAVGEDN
jgi:hypothetical protein